MSVLKVALTKNPHPEFINDFPALAVSYSVLLFDIWGVVHNGIHALPGAVETINQIPENKSVIFLSNMPRPGEMAREKLLSLGIERPFDILTSGDVTRELLKTTYQGQNVYHLGSHRNTDIERGLNLKLVDRVDKADVVLLTAFLEPHEDENQYDTILKEIAIKQIPVLCANPDKTAMNGNQIRKCAGTLAEKLQNQGGQVILIGKPDPLIYQRIFQDFPLLKPHQMLMIGDTLETDIIGANQVGIDSFLVLTGNTGIELQAHNQTLVDYLQDKSFSTFNPKYYGQSLG